MNGNETVLIQSLKWPAVRALSSRRARKPRKACAGAFERLELRISLTTCKICSWIFLNKFEAVKTQLHSSLLHTNLAEPEKTLWLGFLFVSAKKVSPALQMKASYFRLLLYLHLFIKLFQKIFKTFTFPRNVFLCHEMFPLLLRRSQQ